mgnify:CR=1 FL=1
MLRGISNGKTVPIMNIEEQALHPKLVSLIELAPIIKELNSTDVAVTISDQEKVIHQIFSNEFSVDYHVGRKLLPNEPMAQVMRKKEREIVMVPEEAYGVALRVILTPVTDEKGEVIGSIAISTNRDNQSRLLKVAEEFTKSSEEISASIEELASTTENFNTYMEELGKAQKDMNDRVRETTKILEMINTVAKSTRILGFNAGIEAARSGEHGKGFGVVAKEITKLADQSAGSVNEIRKLLDELKEKVTEVAMVVSNTIDISGSQTNSIDDIAKTIHQLSNIAEEIEDMAQKIL